MSEVRGSGRGEFCGGGLGGRGELRTVPRGVCRSRAGPEGACEGGRSQRAADALERAVAQKGEVGGGGGLGRGVGGVMQMIQVGV